jgi:hypothetical protein
MIKLRSLRKGPVIKDLSRQVPGRGRRAVFLAAVPVVAIGALLAASPAQASAAQASPAQVSAAPATASSHVGEPGHRSTTAVPFSTSGAAILQNVHTGWCVDDSAAAHLRDHVCNGTKYQDCWITSNGD